jgi:hypothetical protein
MQTNVHEISVHSAVKGDGSPDGPVEQRLSPTAVDIEAGGHNSTNRRIDVIPLSSYETVRKYQLLWGMSGSSALLVSRNKTLAAPMCLISV